MTNVLEKVYSLLNTNLIAQCPRLSGNTLSHITTSYVKEKSARIGIDAKYYDLNVFEQSGVIVFTNETKNGQTSYANDVNKYGGFFTNNKSTHWVNRACYDSVKAIADEIGAVVINYLPL